MMIYAATKTNRYNLLRFVQLTIVGLTLALLGCGGGGGGGSTTPTSSNTAIPTATATPVPTDSPEVFNDVTLSGSVKTFPSSTSSTPAKISFNKSATGSVGVFSAIGDDGAIGRDEMEPTPALVSIFLLSDVDFLDPIATVKTGSDGDYTITADDVFDYLVTKNLVDSSATQEEIIVAFRALGQLQVRAVVIKERNGDKQVLAIQSIADPNNVDEFDEPVPVLVDPIVHRVVASILDEIKSSIQSLNDLGLSAAVVDELTNTVISNVAAEISRVVSEAADSVITIPEGSSIEDVIAQQESGAELVTDSTGLDELESVIGGSSSDEEAAIVSLQNSVIKADERLVGEDSILTSSLGSEEQGLLSGLQASMTENVTDEVDDTIEQADDLTMVFDTSGDKTTDELLAEKDLEKQNILRKTLQKFFLSMGLVVMVEENDAGDAGVVALRITTPPQLDKEQLPGASGFSDRDIRVFKVGNGTLDAGSAFSSAPLLSDVVLGLLDGKTLAEFQADLDERFKRISDPSLTPLSEDYNIVDRVRLYHEVSQRLDGGTVVSSAVIERLIDNKDSVVKIKALASVIASNFSWYKEPVNLTSEGFPVFTGRESALGSGSDNVDSSELIRFLSLTLDESASDTVEALTSRKSFYAQYAPDAIQQQIQTLSFEGGDNFDMQAALLDLYPSDLATYLDEYKALIVGTTTQAATPSYAQAKDLLARGLTSAVPSTLFGRTLTSESEVNIRSALFLLNFVLNSKYLIDAENGYFKSFDIDTDAGKVQRYVPNFDNLKFLQGSDSVSVSSIVASLLDGTAIDDGDFFGGAMQSIMNGLGELPELPEYKEQNMDDFAGDLSGGTRADVVDVSCAIQRYDGADPADSNNPLVLSVYEANYNSSNGVFTEGSPVDVVIESALVDDTANNLVRTYTVKGLSATNDVDVYGRDYVIKLAISGYENPLPELFVWIDGFGDTLTLCDPAYPLYIGPDQQFQYAPGLGMASDQNRPQADGSSLEEGVDLSNYNSPVAPIYVTSEEEAAGIGQTDFTFVSNGTNDGFLIQGQGDVSFAPLFGEFSDNGLLVSTLASSVNEPLYGINSVVGFDIQALVDEINSGTASLSSTISIASDIDTFDYGRLYAMVDADGDVWIIELSYFEVFEDMDGTLAAKIDFSFASFNEQSGTAEYPDSGFDDCPDCGNGDGRDSNPDIDGDGKLNDEDNCELVPNSGQENTGGDPDLGDACDVVVPDMSGTYLLTLTYDSDSQDFNDVTGQCEAAVDEALIGHVVMKGNQVYLTIHGEKDDDGLLAIMAADGSFDILHDPDGGFMPSLGSYNESASTLSFSFSDIRDSYDGTVQCDASASVSGTPPTEVNEEVVFNDGGISWFDTYGYDFGADYEYGVIEAGAVETQFNWDFAADIPGWVDNSDWANDENYLTDNGIMSVKDLLTVVGYVSAGETAILNPTNPSDASANDVQAMHVDLLAFDVGGLPVEGLVREAFADGMDQSTVFSSGAQVFAATIEIQNDAYTFWCDDDYAPDTLNCQNMIAASYDDQGLPTAATSLDDIIFTSSELTQYPNGGSIWGGAGYDDMGDYTIEIFLSSSDGTVAGSDLMAGFYLNRFDGSFELLDQVDVVKVTKGSVELLEFVIPDAIMMKSELEEDENMPFVFVESAIEQSPIVRQGRKQVGGHTFDDVLYNDVAKTDILGAFLPADASTSAGLPADASTSAGLPADASTSAGVTQP